MKGTNPIIAEQSFNIPIEKVWNAITEVEQMRQWYFDNIPDFRPEVGFETRFNVQSNGMDFMHLWKITEVIPQKKIAYSWNYEDYDGDAWVEFELSEKLNGTELTLSCFGIESFSNDIPDFTRESCQAGWDYFIKDSLPKFLEV